MPRKCINHTNTFGTYVVRSRRKLSDIVTPDLQKLYQLYFGCPLGDQDKDRALMQYVHHAQRIT